MTAEERMKICETCKMATMDPEHGLRCDSTKWINPETGELSRKPMSGWIRGCNCILRYKTADPTARCVLRKW